MTQGWRRREQDEAEQVSKAKLFDMAATVEGETPLAYRISDGVTTDWVPKSQVENNRDGTFTMPEWLAKKKGFL